MLGDILGIAYHHFEFYVLDMLPCSIMADWNGELLVPSRIEAI